MNVTTPQPDFVFHNERLQGMYLSDEHGNPVIITTKYEANGFMSVLQRNGYPVSLVPGDYFFRIKLADPATPNHSN